MLKKILYISFFCSTIFADTLVLNGKKYGFELGLPRLLTISDEWQSFSGGFSYFNHQDQMEYAFPWLYSKEDTSINYLGKKDALKVITLDMHYRKFIEEMGGFYYSGFTRYAYIDGKLANEKGYAKVSKLGVGLGVGYRYFSRNSPFYWGVGMIFGRYVLGDNDMFAKSFMSLTSIDDSPWIVDVELLKFGYAF
jgi:hypothetical protein